MYFLTLAIINSRITVSVKIPFKMYSPEMDLYFYDFQGVSSVAFLHCIEFFRQKYRGVVMVGFGISWAFAQLLATGIAYLVTDWRHMQIIASGLALVTVPYFW